MVPAVPKAFILNSLLENKLSDSLFIINSFIIILFLSMSKNTKKLQKLLVSLLIVINNGPEIGFVEAFFEWCKLVIADQTT